MSREIRLTCLIVILGVLLSHAAERPMISSNESGQLVYTLAENGDQVPDFSYCGFEGSAVPVPSVQVAVVVEPSGDDDTQAIQSALDDMAQAALDNQASNGQMWRGAVVLAPGTFQISTSLYLHGDHVVLRGSQADSKCLTEIRVIGKSRRPAIVVGSDSFDERRPKPTVDAHKAWLSCDIVDYAAIGTTRLNLSNVDGLEVGQTVTIVHPSTQRSRRWG